MHLHLPRNLTTCSHTRHDKTRLFDSLLRAPDLRTVPELIALMANLCSCRATAEVKARAHWAYALDVALHIVKRPSACSASMVNTLFLRHIAVVLCRGAS